MKIKLIVFFSAILSFSSFAQSNVENECANIVKEVDDFTGKITFNTPFSEGRKMYPIIMYKTLEKGKTSYILGISSNGQSSLATDGIGAIILFSDNTKWSKPVKIDVEAGDEGFDYDAYIKLTLTDVNLIGAKKIKKMRLYIFDEILDDDMADKFKTQIGCLKIAK